MSKKNSKHPYQCVFHDVECACIGTIATAVATCPRPFTGTGNAEETNWIGLTGMRQWTGAQLYTKRERKWTRNGLYSVDLANCFG